MRPIGGAVKYLFLLVLVLSSCDVIGEKPVRGWPSLRVYEHYVSAKDMRDRCGQYSPWYESPLACAEFDFDHRICNIYYSNEWPQQEYVRAHEWKHCEGYDHTGSDYMTKLLDEDPALHR